jgi:hypothetical protein
MDEPQKSVSGKWKKEDTVLLIANAIYILIFYVLMQYYTL